MPMGESGSGDLNRDLLEHVRQLPQGEKIDQCIQCGTCTASCPTADAMDFGPRQIIAALRAGETQEVLESNTAWFCASCFLCAVRCPAKIPFTEVMYELKRLGNREDICNRHATGAVLAREFNRSIERHGRVGEAEMMRNYFLGTNPFASLAHASTAVKLFSRGRLHMTATTIKGIDGLKRMLAAAEEMGDD